MQSLKDILETTTKRMLYKIVHVYLVNALRLSLTEAVIFSTGILLLNLENCVDLEVLLKRDNFVLCTPLNLPSLIKLSSKLFLTSNTAYLNVPEAITISVKSSTFRELSLLTTLSVYFPSRSLGSGISIG